MAHIQKIGKKACAFGLRWIDVLDGDLDDTLLAGRPGKDALLAQTPARAKKKEVAKIGLLEPTDPIKGKVWSFAAIAAEAGNDGIYVLRLDDGRYWYAVVDRRNVGSGQEVIGSRDQVIEAVEANVALAMRISETRRVYANVALDDAIESAYFDPVALVNASKTSPLRVLAGASTPFVAVVAILLAVFAAAGWWLFLRGPSAAEQAAASAEAARQAYIGTITSQLEGLPTDHAWVNTAFAKANRSPAFVAGYAKQSVQCSPASCTITYTVERDGAYAPELLRAQVGEGLSIAPGGLAAAVNLPLSTPTVMLDESLIRSWPVLPDQTMERVGMLPIYAPMMVMERDVVVEDLSAMAGVVPEGFMPINRTVIALRVSDSSPLLAADLAALADFWSNGGFVPTSVRWVTGLAGEPPAWSIEFTRISGTM